MSPRASETLDQIGLTTQLADGRKVVGSVAKRVILVAVEDGTVPRWRRGDPIPIWTNPMHVVDTVLKAAMPHLRAFQIETQVRVGYELGRREAQGDCAGMLEARASGEGLSSATRSVLRGMAATIAREVAKGDPR